ncbi:hypothetical protein [Methylobacterium sp. sgz302541]|uniref:hypothetical protein n=1 Tax=unclassified Methylobacterium TaxID=2615210 RepID=UPI003D357978
MDAAGIRTPNLPLSESDALTVLAHVDAGNGTEALRRQTLEVFVQRLLGLAGLDPSGVADLSTKVAQLIAGLAGEITRASGAEALLLPLAGGLRAGDGADYGPDIAYVITDQDKVPALLITTRGEAVMPSRYLQADVPGRHGLDLLYALVGRNRPADNVLAPLGLGLTGTGRLRARLHPIDFARSEWDACLPAEIALRHGARGTVDSVRRVSATLLRYRSTQDGPSLPYVTRTDRLQLYGGTGDTIRTRRSAHILDTAEAIEVQIGYGQSQRATARPAADVGLAGQGEPSRTCWLYQQTIGGDGRPVITAGSTDASTAMPNDGSAERLIDLCGLDFDLRDEAGAAGSNGISLDRVAAQTIQRLRDRYNLHVTPILAIGHAWSATPWTGLKPGTDPWAAGFKMFAGARSLAPLYGKRVRFTSVAFTHDAGNSGDATPYATGGASVLDQMVAAYDGLNLNLELGQDGGLNALSYYLDQTPAHFDETQAPAANRDVLTWCLADPIRRHMVGPRYPWPVADGIHHTALGYLCQGEVEALCKVYCQDLGIGWTPCYVTGATLSGATITLAISGRMSGFGDLVVDTTTIEAATQYGFRVRKVSDGSDMPCTVAVNPDNIVLTLTGGAPAAGTAMEVSHAYRGAAVSSALGHSSCWGNIKRAGPPSVWRPGKTIDAWLCIDARTCPRRWPCRPKKHGTGSTTSASRSPASSMPCANCCNTPGAGSGAPHDDVGAHHAVVLSRPSPARRRLGGGLRGVRADAGSALRGGRGCGTGPRLGGGACRARRAGAPPHPRPHGGDGRQMAGRAHQQRACRRRERPPAHGPPRRRARGERVLIYNGGPEHLRGVLWLGVLALVAGYETVNMFVPNADMILATRIIAGAIYSTVLYVYGREAWKAVRKPKPDRADFLIVGIWLSFLSLLFQTSYAILYRLADAPKWLLNAEIVPLIVMVSILGAICHVAAPADEEGQIPPRNRIAFGVMVGIAALAFGVLVATRPDIRPLIERTRPFIGDWFRTGDALVPGAYPPTG